MTAAKPAPAVNQVWQFEDEVPDVITSIGHAMVQLKSGLQPATYYMANESRWSCVGIETPAGRVMVGERREAASDIEYRVHHVVDGETVWVEDGVYGYGENAKAVASWPLLPPLAQGPLTSDTIPRPSGCRCQWEVGDSECAVHPTCAECGCVVCECKPKGPMSKAAEKALKNPFTAALAELKAIWDPSPSPPDPRLAREQQRRNVSAILADDARRHPAFAPARRCAVLSVYEGEPSLPPDELLPARHAENILRDCHRYETKRGGMTKPSEEARDWGRHAGGTFAVALAEYERNRGAT